MIGRQSKWMISQNQLIPNAPKICPNVKWIHFFFWIEKSIQKLELKRWKRAKIWAYFIRVSDVFSIISFQFMAIKSWLSTQKWVGAMNKNGTKHFVQLIKTCIYREAVNLWHKEVQKKNDDIDDVKIPKSLEEEKSTRANPVGWLNLNSNFMVGECFKRKLN